jgi:hypothetical protein
MECIICCKEIRNNQPFQTLPKDKNCQEERVYHLRACGPGSKNLMAFKENGNNVLRESISGGAVELRLEEITELYGQVKVKEQVHLFELS